MNESLANLCILFCNCRLFELNLFLIMEKSSLCPEFLTEEVTNTIAIRGLHTPVTRFYQGQSQKSIVKHCHYNSHGSRESTPFMSNIILIFSSEYHDEERTRRSTHITNIPEIASVPEGDIQKAIDSSYIKHFNKG